MSEELKWKGPWKCPACFKIMPEKTHKHNVPWNKRIWCNCEMIPYDRRAPDPERDREIEHYRKRADLQEQAALTAVADRDCWKARAEERDKAFRRALELLNDCCAEKRPTYTRLPQDGCECETCNLFRAALEDEG